MNFGQLAGNADFLPLFPPPPPPPNDFLLKLKMKVLEEEEEEEMEGWKRICSLRNSPMPSRTIL